MDLIFIDEKVSIINVPGKDLWHTRARIIRKWNQGYKIDLIFIDEQVDVAGSVIWCGGLEFVGRLQKKLTV
ncbi:hypothetical protein HanIR_Chr16g0795851 [Helianthus annuus]|nr:hypothetical protein HanIR_Chr16g0795851 [Helianthus annuus]